MCPYRGAFKYSPTQPACARRMPQVLSPTLALPRYGTGQFPWAWGLCARAKGREESSERRVPLSPAAPTSDGASILRAACRPRCQQAGCCGARAARHGSPATRCPRWPAHGWRESRGERGLQKGGHAGKSLPERMGQSPSSCPSCLGLSRGRGM